MPQHAVCGRFGMAGVVVGIVAAGAALVPAGCGGSTTHAKPGGVVAGIGQASVVATSPSTSEGGRAPVSIGATAVPGANETAQNFRVDSAQWAALGYRLDWTGFPFVDRAQPNALRDLAVLDRELAVRDRSGGVALLDAANGQLKWRTELDSPLTRFVGMTPDPRDDRRLLVASESEVFTLLLDSGSLQQREPIARIVNTAPIAADGLLILGGPSGEILGHRLGTGLKQWGFLGVGGIERNGVRIGRSIAHVSQAGDVTFIEPRSGSLVGRARIFGGIESDPVAAADVLVVASLDQSLYAFDETGRVLWRYRTPHQLRNQPAIAEGSVYLTIPEMGLTAFDLATGQVKWNNPNAAGVVRTVRSGRLLVQDGRTVHSIDPARGSVVASIDVPGMDRLVATAPKDGVLYLLTDRNQVVKLAPQ